MAQRLTAHPAEIETEDTMLDVLVVGAGPHALSLVCRLLETIPDSLYNDVDLTTMSKYQPGSYFAPRIKSLLPFVL